MIIKTDFNTSAIKYLNENHNLSLRLTGSVNSIKVNPTFSILEKIATSSDGTSNNNIKFNPIDLKKSLNKMLADKPIETHFMLKGKD